MTMTQKTDESIVELLLLHCCIVAGESIVALLNCCIIVLLQVEALLHC